MTCEGTDDSTCGLEGGALVIDNDSSTLNNNTFSDNTITCNSSTCNVFGSSIFVDEGSEAIDMLNTIVDNDPGVVVPNCSGSINDDGNNLQFPGSSCGGTIATADPMLGPLDDNGGITQTKAISEDSPAFNEGNNATCEATDQRGVVRPQEIICDIGAYELIPSDEPPLPPSGPIVIIPTMGQWAMIFTSIILGLFAVIILRRKEKS